MVRPFTWLHRRASGLTICPPRNAAARIIRGDSMHRFASLSCLLVLVAALMAAGPAQAQTQASRFKVGDAVEVFYAGKWTPGVVSKEPQTAPFLGVYIVNDHGSIMMAGDTPAEIRAHQNNAAEQALASQSAHAFANWPRGNGIGAQYGAREPAQCASRKAAPNAQLARQYLLCDMEGLDGFGNLDLLTGVTVQIGTARGFLYEQDSGRSQIDVRAPVYDIRGSFTQFQCDKPNRAAGAYVATHNCNVYPQPQAAGACYRDTFGDWHCAMVGSRLASASQIQYQMPPR